MVDTAETIGNALAEVLEQSTVEHKKFIVLERDFGRERIVFESDSKPEADRIAAQHGARRVVFYGKK